jgi:hypothetical protein
MAELHEYESAGDYQRRPAKPCAVCGQPFDTEVHHVTPEGWCEWDQPEHDYGLGRLECVRCGAEEPQEDDYCEECQP